MSQHIDYAKLKTELLTDPNGYGYAPHYAAGSDQTLADMLNLVRAAIQIKRSDISPSEIFHALDLADMVTNPGATTNSYMESLFTAPFTIRLLNDDGSSTPVRNNILTMLKAGTTGTKTRLAALELRAGSRGEQLFYAGVIVTQDDIIKARAA